MEAEMSQPISLKEAERKVFHSTVNDGLWDIFLGIFFLEFVIAPYLSESMGDFWSVAVFLPVWAVAYLAIRVIRKKVVEPRIGMVKFGPARISKIKRFSYVMLAFNCIALILGIWVALSFNRTSGEAIPYMFSILLLAGFSMAAFFLEFNRLYVYGLLIALAPVAGEWLWKNGYAAHHGWPITFGVISGIMILVGLLIFIRLMRNNPIPDNFVSAES
jgi:hypothetical protein